MRIPKWLLLSLAVPILWGLWGALTEIPEKWIDPPFPPTMGYAVWSLTMLPFMFIALHKIGWKVSLSRDAPSSMAARLVSPAPQDSCCSSGC